MTPWTPAPRILTPVRTPPRSPPTPEAFSAVCDALQQKGYTFISADVAMVPHHHHHPDRPRPDGHMAKLLDALDDDDDVQNAWHNLENEEDWTAESGAGRFPRLPPEHGSPYVPSAA